MGKKNRRKFLKELGIAGGLVAFGKYASDGFPLFTNRSEETLLQATDKIKGRYPVTFEYAPAFWQSTYCFPDDPYKSLVGKKGELLYGHPGLEADIDAFAHRISVGVLNALTGEFLEQRIEAPGIPIITTKLDFAGVQLRLVSFATDMKEEGRVDNLLIEFVPKGQASATVSPVVVIRSQGKFKTENENESHVSRRHLGAVYLESEKDRLFMAVDSSIELKTSDVEQRIILQPGAATSAQPLKFLARFPQEGQSLDKIRDLMAEPEKLVGEARLFWQAWKPFDGKVKWQVQEQHEPFLVASARNILESREIINGKKMFKAGTMVHRGPLFVEEAFLLEAARYLGHDKEADDGMKSMWDLQDSDGAFYGGTGKYNWKDTGAALYMLARQSDLAQNWDFFQESWTDAHKAAMFLKNLREKSVNDGTSNGKYALLPRGFGDGGMDGVRSEFTNTLWALIGLKAVMKVADRFGLARRDEVKGLYRDIFVLFYMAYQKEMRDHPKGFKYLPMLMKEDPAWLDPDERKRPRPQVAQCYLSHAIFPGLVIKKERDEAVITGHLKLMQSVVQEDIPAETGWLSHGAVWTYNAPMVAQVYLCSRMPELARKTFAGFLNHASPLYAWRGEQSLLASHLNQYIGDMPHNLASAECICFLRNMMIMEDEEKILLIEGIVEEDILAGKPIRIEYSPTRWGRVSVSFEPIDNKTWSLKFKREDFDSKHMWKLTNVEFSRRLPLKFQLDKVIGAQAGSAEIGRVIVDGSVTSWEAVFRTIG